MPRNFNGIKKILQDYNNYDIVIEDDCGYPHHLKDIVVDTTTANLIFVFEDRDEFDGD